MGVELRERRDQERPAEQPEELYEEALQNDALVREAPAIVGCQSPSALAYAARMASRSQ